jgi:archaeosine synthase
MYPASSYDILVTHFWFDDELTMISSLLNKYLKHNQYQSIISYLPDQLQNTIHEAFSDIITPTISKSPSTQSDLDTLTSLLTDLTKDCAPVSSSQRRKDDMMCRSMVQFTSDIAETLLQNTLIKGKYPYLKIMDNKNTQLGMLTEKRGMISLTLQGSKRIATHRKFHVHISSDFTLKGSVFAPGIIDADPDIRRGDEALVFQQEELIAVGVSLMDGDEMMQRKNGKAVDIRHHQ